MSDTEYISKDAFIEQQRKQYCENCERRKGIKNGKRIFVYEIGEAPCRACDIEDMIDAVWDFLPADVAPVIHGQWETYTYVDGFVCAVCSSCKWNSGAMWWGYAIKHFDFCPHCGAKMDESEE